MSVATSLPFPTSTEALDAEEDREKSKKEVLVGDVSVEGLGSVGGAGVGVLLGVGVDVRVETGCWQPVAAKGNKAERIAANRTTSFLIVLRPV